MKKIIFYIVLFLICAHSLSIGQSSKSKKETTNFINAENEFADLRYMYAIPFYKASLKKEKNNDSIACLHLAASYWQVKNYDSALAYYQLFERKFGALFFTSQRIAELFATKKQYPNAITSYQKLIKEYPLRYTTLLSKRLQGFSYIDSFFQDSLDFKVRLLQLNTNQQDFSPQYYNRGMVFVSNRYPKPYVAREFGWDGLPFANIYWVKDTLDLYLRDSIPAGYTYRNNRSIKANDDYTKRTSNDNNIILASTMKGNFGGEIHRLAKFSDDLETKYNYGPLCFTKDGKTVYFTRNSKIPFEGKYNLEICEATFENNIWTNIQIMPFVKKEYDYFHPAISTNGEQLFYCSNQPGGLGGSDIYYISLSKNAIRSNAFNLGKEVNTEGNELFPTFNGDDLYFSSDGWPGLGSQDIYKTSNAKQGWSVPLNLGSPINSSFDDFGIIYNTGKSKGFFSSNRLGSDDIFTFNYLPVSFQLQGTVFSKATRLKLDSVTVLLRNVNVTKALIDTFTTSITGQYTFPFKPGNHYLLQFTRNGFIEDSLHINANADTSVLTLPDVFLAQIKVAPPPPIKEMDRDGDGVIDLKDKCPDVKGIKENYGCPDIQARLNELAKMVFFKTASHELLPAALIPLNEVASILAEYPWVTLAIEGHTDSRAPAPYNLDLSNRRANSVRSFFINKGLAANRFTAVGYGLTRPIGDNKTAEGRQLNRRVLMIADFHYKYE